MFQPVADFITYNLLYLNQGTRLTSSINFFIYDTLKILFLIFFVVSIIAFVKTFLPTTKLKNMMLKTRFGLGNLAAAVFGAVTPFCSCSSIPIFIGFLKAKVPVGIAFSFLITSPLVNEVAFVIMGGMFGWKLAALYAISGILLGVIAGMILGALKMEKNIILDNEGKDIEEKYLPKTFSGKLQFALTEGKKTLEKLLPYIIGGVAVGAAIHGYVPQEFFENYVGKNSILSVPIAVIIGIPIYAGCSTIVPLIFSITANGVPLGTSLAFMMAIAGLSLPEAIILKRVMKFKLLLAFFATVAVGITIIGYLFNFLGTTGFLGYQFFQLGD
ncbi:MAG: permease [Candidatus Gracilibacteria bacterium]